MSTISLATAAFALSFAIGWKSVFSIFADSKTKISTRILFSFAWANSTSLLLLVLLEICLPPLNEIKSRDSISISIWWKVQLVLSITLSCLLIPFSLSLQFISSYFMNNHTIMSRKYPISLAATASFCLLMHQIGLIFPREFNIDKFTLGGIVANVGLIGVTLMASLSGFVAINSPYQNLAVFVRNISEKDIADAETRLISTIDRLFDVRKKMASTSSSTSFASPLSLFGYAPSLSLEKEAEALEMFMAQLHFDLDALHSDKERCALAKKWRGVYNNFLGYFFSLYCLFKVLSSIYNIAVNPQPGRDPVTRVLNIVVHSIGIPLDLEFWSAQLSFLFIGVMVVVAVRGLLINLTKVNQATATTSSADLPIIIFTHIISFYILSVVIMIRLNIAEQYRTVITAVLGNLEIVFFQRLFDWWFLLAAAISAVYHIYIAQSKALF